MSNTDEIVKRLRATGGKGQSGPLKWQAAALIEQQRDEIARLRGALEPIAGCANLNDGSWYFMTPSLPMLKAARHALEGTTPAGLDRQGPRNDAG